MENFGTLTILTYEELKSVHEEKVRKAIRIIRKDN